VASLHLPPDSFWASSPREIAAAVDRWNEEQGDGEPPPLTRAELEDLMERYPDGR